MGSEISRFPVVAVIPSLNPDERLFHIVDGLITTGFTSVILVDDGSRRDCRYWFDMLEQWPQCVVLHHEANRGKGRALKTAFIYYLEHFDLTEYLGVVTADADGQHLPEDIYRTAGRLLREPSLYKKTNSSRGQSLILGTRDFNSEIIPSKSRNGNRITTVVFQLLYGKRINDTQTGLRAISNNFLYTCLESRGERFEYEINMLISAVTQKIDIQEETIQTIYFNNNRETHFRPVTDSLKIYWVMFSSFLKFICSSLSCMLVDQGLFSLLQKNIFAAMGATFSIPLSTLLARIVSSYLNFSINRKVVFEKERNSNGFFLRYYVLCVLQMTISAAGVTALYALTRLDTSILKFLVDVALFFISYRIQRGWVFKECNQ